MSLWETDAIAAVFSLCGSFWYPGVADFIEEHVPKNYSAQVYLQNGIREGDGHNNRLCDAYSYAQRVHTALGGTCAVNHWRKFWRMLNQGAFYNHQRRADLTAGNADW